MTRQYLLGTLDSAFLDICDSLDAIHVDIPNSLDKEGQSPAPLENRIQFSNGEFIQFSDGNFVEFSG